MRFVVLIFGLFLAAGCNVSADHHQADKVDVAYLKAPGTEEMDLPFTAAVRLGNTLYLSGALGIPPGTRQLIEGGIQAETRQTLDNISQTLKNSGSSIDNVVKCTVFLADMSEWAAMNEVYTTYFENKPARSAIAASGLALDARVEIECIAWVD